MFRTVACTTEKRESVACGRRITMSQCVCVCVGVCVCGCLAASVLVSVSLINHAKCCFFFFLVSLLDTGNIVSKRSSNLQSGKDFTESKVCGENNNQRFYQSSQPLRDLDRKRQTDRQTHRQTETQTQTQTQRQK